MCLNSYADKIMYSNKKGDLQHFLCPCALREAVFRLSVVLNINISDKHIVNKLNSSGVVLCGLNSRGDVHYKRVNKTRAAAYS